jgi:chromosome segregation protein
MYLSKIEVIGFKSFAQRVNVKFDAGVTAIVGPNGCGKTNIVDAIRWALGEQRYSTLRSDKMEDVIFNGTKNRKPLGLAEVSLTIENTKGILPTEYSEVTITRRVFRSGDSEYLLNKVPCRLKDILDLFMDTGMGSDAYSVIELKMVESILSDKTDERRKLFEEAAGVTKYKHRRKAAIRKLEDVQQDLARVNDIVKEVQKTVNSLERQAKKAEQYNEVSTRLKNLEIDLLEREYAYLHSKLKPHEEQFRLATTDRTSFESSLKAQEDQIDQLREGLNAIETELADIQRSVSDSGAAVHRVEEKILVNTERRNALDANIVRYRKDKEELYAQRELLEQEKASLTLRGEELLGEVTAADSEYQRQKEAWQRDEKLLEEKKEQVLRLRDETLAVAHDIVSQGGEQERLKSRMENFRGRIDRAREDNALYEQDIARHQEAVAQLTQQDRELRRRFVEAEMKLLEGEQNRKRLNDELNKSQKSILAIQHDIDRRSAQIDLLKRIVETSEGYSDGTRHLLEQPAWKERQLVTVADVIDTEERYRRAIEVALAQMASVLVIDSVDEGVRAVEELHRQGKGRVSFLCLEWVPAVRSVRRHKKNARHVWANEVVTCDERYRPLINFLLGNIVLAESIDDARKVFADFSGIRCITLDGLMLTSGGLLKSGRGRQEGPSPIGTKSQIDQLKQEIADLHKLFDEQTGRKSALQQEHDAVDLKAMNAAVKLVEKEMTAIEMRIAQLEFEKKRANDGIERNGREIESLEQEILDLGALLDAVKSRLSDLDKKKREGDARALEAQQQLEQYEIAWNEKTRLVNELEIKLVTLQGDLRNARRDRERAEARSDDVQTTLVNRTGEIQRAEEEIVRLGEEDVRLQEEQTLLQTQFAAIESRRSSVDQLYHTRRNELHQIELHVKDERRLFDDAVTTAHDYEMKIAELKSNIEHLKLRAQEEFELELALKTYPDDEWVDFAQLRDEVKNLKERIRILGAINFAAFDEFTSESERLNFLTQQRDDLIEAEKTLMSTIEEINNTAQRIFSETFAKIRENFIVIFKDLFMEGDECDLKLEEGVDPLEANIEIIAKPRGKRPTSIDLLSGGEKTLTAIALLFAIYLVKPSPFCILDEVDAPLDDSNIDRYTRILKKFSNNTQFIVVTHNKRTMEAAHALYGVTMEEEGVSKIVTVRFNEDARIRSATVSG